MLNSYTLLIRIYIYIFNGIYPFEKKSQIRGVKKSDNICRWVDKGYLRDKIL